MTKVTDAMVEAACNKEWELVQKWPLRSDERFVFMNKPNMRAVLEAALLHAAAEPVDTTEFDQFALLVTLHARAFNDRFTADRLQGIPWDSPDFKRVIKRLKDAEDQAFRAVMIAAGYEQDVAR